MNRKARDSHSKLIARFEMKRKMVECSTKQWFRIDIANKRNKKVNQQQNTHAQNEEFE